MRALLAASALLALAACASTPTGPGVMVLPGSGKSFDQFRADDFECRQFAQTQVGGTTAQKAAVNSGVSSAAVGTAIGAVAGAAIDGSHGAGVGAGLGLAAGALAGTGAASASAGTLQQRYDMGYQQCMYAKGHKIPMAASRYDRRPAYRDRTATPPPPPPPPPSWAPRG